MDNKFSSEAHDKNDKWKNYSFCEALKIIYHDGENSLKDSKDSKNTSTAKNIKLTLLQSIIVMGMVIAAIWLGCSKPLSLSPDNCKSFIEMAMVIISILVGAAMMALPLVVNNPVFSKSDPRPQTQKNEVICTATIFILIQITMLVICLCASLLYNLCTDPVITYITGSIMCCTVFFCVIADLKIIVQIALYSISTFSH